MKKKKGTISILETIRNKMRKIEKTHTPIETDDDFEYIDNSSKDIINSQNNIKSATVGNQPQTPSAISDDDFDFLSHDEEEEAAEKQTNNSKSNTTTNSKNASYVASKTDDLDLDNDLEISAKIEPNLNGTDLKTSEEFDDLSLDSEAEDDLDLDTPKEDAREDAEEDAEEDAREDSKEDDLVDQKTEEVQKEDLDEEDENENENGDLDEEDENENGDLDDDEDEETSIKEPLDLKNNKQEPIAQAVITEQKIEIENEDLDDEDENEDLDEEDEEIEENEDLDEDNEESSIKEPLDLKNNKQEPIAQAVVEEQKIEIENEEDDVNLDVDDFDMDDLDLDDDEEEEETSIKEPLDLKNNKQEPIVQAVVEEQKIEQSPIAQAVVEEQKIEIENEEDDVNLDVDDLNLDDLNLDEVIPANLAPKIAVEKTEDKISDINEDDLDLVDLPDSKPIQPTPQIINNTENNMNDKTSIISESVAKQTKDSIKELIHSIPKKQQFLQSPSPAFKSGETIEDMVLAILTPKLEQWVNENLPEMVEKIVREEIKKLIPQE